MEKVNCNLCQADNTEPVYDFSPWMIVRCRECSLVYLNPRPSGDELHSLYSEDYYSNYLSAQYPTDEKSVRHSFDSMAWMLDIIKPFKASGRLLEIGCATGFFLACARNAGYDTWGVEISEYGGGYAKERFNLNVQIGTVEEVDLPHDYFDIIVMSHVIEHFPDPMRSLQKINSLLKTDGVLLIRTPDISSFDARYYHQRWSGLSVPFHLYFFSQKSLTKLLRCTNFNVIKTDFWVSPIIMDPILRIAAIFMPTEHCAIPFNRSGCTIGIQLSRSSPFRRFARRTAYRLFKGTIGRFFRGRTMTVVANRALREGRDHP